MSRCVQENIPITEEMVVRQHAHWERVYIDYKLPPEEEFTDRLAMCSHCKHIDGRYTFAYVQMVYMECPYCKAFMDEVTE